MNMKRLSHKLIVVSLVLAPISIVWVIVISSLLLDTAPVLCLILMGIVPVLCGFFSTLADYCNKRYEATVRKLTTLVTVVNVVVFAGTVLSAVTLAISAGAPTYEVPHGKVPLSGNTTLRVGPRVQMAAVYIFLTMFTVVYVLPGRLFIRIFKEKLDARLAQEMTTEDAVKIQQRMKDQREAAVANRKAREEEAESRRRQQEALEEWERRHKNSQ